MTRAALILSPVVAIAFAAAAHAAPADDAQKASATLKNVDGQTVGRAQMTQTPGGVLVTLQLENIPAGVHAFHVHENGQCEPPFQSAGGHFNPAKAEHGLMHQGEAHAGDMPNLHVPENGKLVVEILNSKISLKSGEANAATGKALIIHAGKDDYASQPSGDAGGRIACGIIGGQ